MDKKADKEGTELDLSQVEFSMTPVRGSSSGLNESERKKVEILAKKISQEGWKYIRVPRRLIFSPERISEMSQGIAYPAARFYRGVQKALEAQGLTVVKSGQRDKGEYLYFSLE